MSSPKEVRDHLRGHHGSELSKLTDCQLTERGLYLCRECEDYVTDSESLFEDHLKKHVVTRVPTNFQLLSDLLYIHVKNSEHNHWADGLAWLKNHQFQEPPFRQSLINSIRFRLKTDILDAMECVLMACVESSKKPADPRLVNCDSYDPDPVWLLAFLFEQLVLAPNPDPENISINQLIHRRLRLFRSGQLEQLHIESQQIESKAPRDFAANPVDIQRCAQNSADQDNRKSALARLTKHMPVAKMTPSNIGTLINLFPKSLGLNCVRQMLTRGAVDNRRRVTIAPSEILGILAHLHRGKAPGIYVDSLDIYVELATRYLYNENLIKSGRSAGVSKVLAKFFTHVVNGDVGPKVKFLLRTTYTVALHKDPDDDTKLRPLGIPTAIRRIAAILIISKYRSDFAKYLLPYNYAVGVSGGIDFITTTLRLGVERYITDPESKGEFPSRALVSLDIRNMFNAISREKLIEVISREFPHLERFANCL